MVARSPLLKCGTGQENMELDLRPATVGGEFLGFRIPRRNKVSFLHQFSEVAQSCLTLCDPIDCSLPGSPVRGIFQAIVLEWVAISFSRGSSQPRARTQVSGIVDRRFTV